MKLKTHTHARTHALTQQSDLPPDEDEGDPLMGERRRYFLLVASFAGLRNDGFASELSGDWDCKLESIRSQTWKEHNRKLYAEIYKKNNIQI